MKPVLLEELKRIHEIMGSNPKIIMEAAGGPGPIAKFFEKLGVRSESEFDDLRRKVMNGNATEEEIYAFRAADDVMFNAQKTFDEVIEQNSDEIYEILMKNQDFLKLGKQVWLELNPTFEKVYNQIKNIPNIEKYSPDNLQTWKENKLKTVDGMELPEFVKQDLKSEIESKYKQELPRVNNQFNKLVSDINLTISEFSDYIVSTKSYFDLTPAEKVKFNENLKKAKKLLNSKITKDNPKVEEDLRLLVKQYQALDKNAIQKLTKLGGEKWSTYSTTKKAIIAVVLILAFPSLAGYLGYAYGYLDLGKATESFQQGKESGEKAQGDTNSNQEETTELTKEEKDAISLNFATSYGTATPKITKIEVVDKNNVNVTFENGGPYPYSNTSGSWK